MIRSILLAAAILAALAQGDSIRSFDGNTGWLNSPPLTAADLRGKVVLVDFWEYTCINCLRTLPYLRTWYQRYRDDGFTIVGVHAPEFAFSGERSNVAAALVRLNVTWPVVMDDNFAVWKRYDVNAWPTEFLYDPNGKLIERMSGEGGYPQTEAKIQALLRAANPHLKLPPVMALLPQDSYDKPGAVCYPKTAEILVERTGVANMTRFVNAQHEADYVDVPANGHRDGELYLQGYWRLEPQAAISASADGYVALRYHAIQVVAVLKPESGASGTRVIVTQDGKPLPHADAGSDIRYDDHGNSYVTVEAAREYDLVMNATFGQHELRLMPQRYGIGIYDVAFESCEAGK